MAEESAVAVARALRAVAQTLSELADDLTTPSGRSRQVEESDTEADDDMDMPVGP
jgi:hypothetical protein